MTDDVLFETRGASGLITLNRPKALNALTHEMCVAMKAIAVMDFLRQPLMSPRATMRRMISLVPSRI